MAKDSDWYPTTASGERALYANIDDKITAYATKYEILIPNYLLTIHGFCKTYIEVYDKTVEIRATAKQLTAYLENLMKNPAKGTLPPDPPQFANISLPVNSSVGIEAQMRDLARLLKSQPNYDFADGLDLMIERESASAPDHSNFAPDIKVGLDSSGDVTIEWKKSGFDSLEVQYRRPGDAMWQAADKSTAKVITFTPPLTTPGTPEKFEFRAICLIKNVRVGLWSTIHTVIAG